MRVSLVGAGPGDAGLLTIMGTRRIQSADVVLFDRFVSKEILAMIPVSAEVIDVGKNAGSHPVPQSGINRLLLEKAKQGFNVVRLKGGDPFLFGRGGEELELLAENGIPFEVVPGVSSAIAAAAYAGIPVTHRDYVSSLHIISGHAKNNETPKINYNALVRTNGTLVFLMGVTAVEEICKGCIAAGMSKDMPAAIVENATTSKQRKFVGTVETLPVIVRENAVKSPATIIIGMVCGLSGRYDWFSQRPLFGTHIIVARVKPGISKLSERLREMGAHVTELLCAKITPLTVPGCLLEKALENIADYSWLVFTSSIGVNVFFNYLIEAKIDIRQLHHIRIACVGTETEKEVGKRGINTDYCPGEYNGAALALGLCKIIKSGERVLIARAKDGAEDLTRVLTEAGINYDDVAIYEKTRWGGHWLLSDAEYAPLQVAFTCSSSVEIFAESMIDIDFSKIKAVCIGERTAGTARSYGMEAYVSTEATIDSMVKRIEEINACQREEIING